MKDVPKSCFCGAESYGGDGNFDSVVSSNAALLAACVGVFGAVGH